MRRNHIIKPFGLDSKHSKTLEMIECTVCCSLARLFLLVFRGKLNLCQETAKQVLKMEGSQLVICVIMNPFWIQLSSGDVWCFTDCYIIEKTRFIFTKVKCLI